MDPSQLPPNYDESRKATVIGVSIFLMLVCTLMISLRIWTRKVVINQMGVDDYLAIATLVCVPTLRFPPSIVPVAQRPRANASSLRD